MFNCIFSTIYEIIPRAVKIKAHIILGYYGSTSIWLHSFWFPIRKKKSIRKRRFVLQFTVMSHFKALLHANTPTSPKKFLVKLAILKTRKGTTHDSTAISNFWSIYFTDASNLLHTILFYLQKKNTCEVLQLWI